MAHQEKTIKLTESTFSLKTKKSQNIFDRLPQLDYEKNYKKSIENPKEFFTRFKDGLEWYGEDITCCEDHCYKNIKSKSINDYFFGFDRIDYFKDTFTNACYNCLDRHKKGSILLTYEMNDGTIIEYSREDLLLRVYQYCNLIKKLQVNVPAITIFLPMSPDNVCAVLACARLGIPHSVVFSGYSADSLITRIFDSKSSILIITDKYVRGDKVVDISHIIHQVEKKMQEINYKLDIILLEESYKKNFELSGHIINFEKNEIKNYAENLNEKLKLENYALLSKHENFNIVNPVPVCGNHPLFYLYTSGSTGKPKGIVHGTSNYLIYAMYTIYSIFYNGREMGRNFYCTADLGWITGHTYAVYGPLLLGLNTIITFGLPTLPREKIYKTLSITKCSVYYTAPTAIRVLKEINLNTNLSFNKLKLLGSVGEPLNTSALVWYAKKFSAPVIDTYWQTETGGILCAPLTLSSDNYVRQKLIPLYGIKVEIFRKMNQNERDEYMKKILMKNDNLILMSSTDFYKKFSTGDKILIIKENKEYFISCGENELGYICIGTSWPGQSQTILNDKERFFETYYKMIPSYYFTGDEGMKIDDHLVVHGRADDVLNISAHRVSTAEIEDIVLRHKKIYECAAVGKKHKVTGESLVLFCAVYLEEDYSNEIRPLLINGIGKFVKPELIIFSKELPKTRTGKIMRRTLRALLKNEDVGDLSTCMNPECLDEIRQKLQ